jgi:hypothetical protein
MNTQLLQQASVQWTRLKTLNLPMQPIGRSAMSPLSSVLPPQTSDRGMAR